MKLRITEIELEIKPNYALYFLLGVLLLFFAT